MVNLRIMSVSKVPHLKLPELLSGAAIPEEARKGTRRALFEETGDYIDTPVYQREALLQGNVMEGPAIIEQFDSTTVVLPGQRAEVHRFGTIMITVDGAGS